MHLKALKPYIYMKFYDTNTNAMQEKYLRDK